MIPKLYVLILHSMVFSSKMSWQSTALRSVHSNNRKSAIKMIQSLWNFGRVEWIRNSNDPPTKVWTIGHQKIESKKSIKVRTQNHPKDQNLNSGRVRRWNYNLLVLNHLDHFSTKKLLTYLKANFFENEYFIQLAPHSLTPSRHDHTSLWWFWFQKTRVPLSGNVQNVIG